MIILRSKSFAQPQQIPQQPEQPATMQDLNIEQMRLQRAMIQNQKSKVELQAQKDRDKLRSLQQKQRLEADKEQRDTREQIQTKRIESENNKPQNMGLYKSKAKTTEPVSMK